MEEQDIKPYVGYSVITGSTAHGTAIAGSDVDVKSVVRLPDQSGYTLGKAWEGEVLHNPDVEYFSFLRFVGLLRGQHVVPHEMLWVDDSLILTNGVLGKRLREERSHFLTSAVRHAWTGFADSFLLNIKERYERQKGSTKDEIQKYTDLRMERTLNLVLENARDTFDLEGVSISYGTKSGHYVKDEELLVRFDGGFVPASVVSAVTKSLSSSHKDFMKRKINNETIDTDATRKDIAQSLRIKHAAYIALENGTAYPNAGEFIPVAKGIRKGDYTWEEIFSLDRELTSKVEQAYKTTCLPPRVDDDFLSGFVRSALEETRC